MTSVQEPGLLHAAALTSRPVDLSNSGKSRFVIGDEDFLLDGTPFRILSGALHYFRVHPDQWADRIRKAHQMGLNTIETYVPWNAHSPRRGEFFADGGLDLGRFLDLVHAEGMRAIVRPGPYICAEWTNGGIPPWVFDTAGVQIRRDEPGFVTAVGQYFVDLSPILEPRQIDGGGPIIMVQIENEYGAYGDDSAYLQKLVVLNREIGISVPLFTVDQPEDEMLKNGGLPGLHRTGSFGSRVSERLHTLRAHQPSGPLMCSEFWDGWFDDWGAGHHVTPVKQTTKDLAELLERGASINIYMFHGGTNFGFTNGANDKGVYEPITTSYDYDAPLDEAGNPTAKYWAFRDVLARFGTLVDGQPVAARPAQTSSWRFEKFLPMRDTFDQLGAWSSHEELPSADALGSFEGFTVYRARIDAPDGGRLEVTNVRDRAHVFLDGHEIGIVSRAEGEAPLTLPRASSGMLEFIVEDQGRVDYGPRLGESKGLIGPVLLNDLPLHQWDAIALDLSAIAPVASALVNVGADESTAVPGFAAGTFEASGDADLFLDTGKWGKGVVWINGFNLGRYWSRGPQRTLYVPAPILRTGANELVRLELDKNGSSAISFVARHRLG